jgi:hypothetical protein
MDRYATRMYLCHFEGLKVLQALFVLDFELFESALF